MEHPVLSFLLTYLTDLHMQCILTDGTGVTLAALDAGLRNSILKREEASPSGVLKVVEDDTIYHITDYYACSYSFFRFPSEKQFLFIGPYLTKDISAPDIDALMDMLQIPQELFGQLQDYYNTLPRVTDKNSFSSLLRHLYSTVFSTGAPSIHYLDLKTLESQEAFLKKHQFVVSDDPALSMQLLEKRYHIEDELLDAVSHGNATRALAVLDTMRAIRFPQRTGSVLRDQKNLTITLNSLLRRTTYEAGVHPFYIDAVSSNYARLLEQCSSTDETNDIIPYMVRSYCNLVEKRSMSSYSEPVRQMLVTIDASLNGDLSLKRFAKDLFLNTSYLSTLFKKEVGMTLTDYVNKNRIEYAQKLLRSTTLSIQDIAVQSGISDIHYFTRLFRRKTGMSPRDWRNQMSL